MRVPKLVIFLLMLGAAVISYIYAAVHSQIEMFHMFDESDNKKPGAASASTTAPSTMATAGNVIESEESANSESESESDSETDSKSAPASSSTSAGTTAISTNTEPKDTYSRLVAPTIKIKNGRRPRLDLAFCIDTTSSMQGEIDTVKAKVKSMVTKIAQSKQRPIVRVGLVAYRDNGDDYVTKVFQFSENIDDVVRTISDLAADGGGDGPEAVDRGLHAAINDLEWDNSRQTAKLLFLIGDAPPHTDQPTYDWKQESRNAIAQGIHINTIGCDGLEGYTDNGIQLFKQIALLTNGNFEPLSYHQEIVDTKGKAATLITSGGRSYVMKSTDKEAWKSDISTLVARGDAAPSLQGATNGTIGVQGSDATYVTGVNTAGTVRTDNNLDAVMLKGAEAAVSKLGF